MKEPKFFIEAYAVSRWYGKFFKNGQVIDFKHFDYWRRAIMPFSNTVQTIAIWKIYPKTKTND